MVFLDFILSAIKTIHITTVLGSIYKTGGLIAWRKNVGEEAC